MDNGTISAEENSRLLDEALEGEALEDHIYESNFIENGDFISQKRASTSNSNGIYFLLAYYNCIQILFFI